MPADGNISNAMLPPQCVGVVPLMHSPALTQPLAEVLVVVAGEQLLRVMGHRHQVHYHPLRTHTHLLRIATARMPVKYELMRIHLQTLELMLLTRPQVWFRTTLSSLSTTRK